MNASSRFPTHHVPDEGVRYVYGDVVRIDQSSGRVEIVKDPEGDYEVMNCRPATEYAAGPPLLRVGLRKRTGPRIETPDERAPRLLHEW
jgi:hypothetical protein